ncbi:MAG: hypothetical protein PWR10_635 [Halanaerobiales bacterium]|nr:hypothetical protein [Halanaerobiales bacterium]
MLKIAFRVDGGSSVGMGHLVRCLALANAFPGQTGIIFITKSESGVNQLLHQHGFEMINIFSGLDYDGEIATVKDIIINEEIDILITDSYQIEQNYLNQMKEVVKLLVTIHDFAPYAFPSDIFINGNIYAQDLEYSSLTGKTRFLLGTKYTLLRDEFSDLPKRRLNKRVRRILVTVGGGDPLNLSSKIIRALKLVNEKITGDNLEEMDNLHVDLVIGPAFNNLTEIIKVTRDMELEIALHFNIHKISNLMLNCDLAVSAGGSTLYELAATGTPALALLQAENQALAAQYFEKAGIIINLGPGDRVKEEELVNSILDLGQNYERRCRMSQQGQLLVDGQGARRCVKKILKNIISSEGKN